MLKHALVSFTAIALLLGLTSSRLRADEPAKSAGPKSEPTALWPGLAPGEKEGPDQEKDTTKDTDAKPGGKRIMHAAIRRHLTHDPARPWDASLGVPINQEDLAGTLMSFSLLVMEGRGRLGLELSPAEREGYLRTWTGVGRILGVQSHITISSMQGPLKNYQEIVDRLKGLPGVQSVAPMIDGEVFISANGTGTGAYMRGYRVLVPADCVAARKPADRARSLGLMRRVLGADTRPSARIDLPALRSERPGLGPWRLRCRR